MVCFGDIRLSLLRIGSLTPPRKELDLEMLLFFLEGTTEAGGFMPFGVFTLRLLLRMR